MSLRCLKCARWLQTWSAAKLQTQFATSAAWKSMWMMPNIISMGVTLPEWRKTALLGEPHMDDCFKRAHLHILLVLQAAALPTINALLHMLRVWLAVPGGARGRAITPLDQLSGYINMQFTFSTYLVNDLQFVLGSFLYLNVSDIKTKSDVEWWGP